MLPLPSRRRVCQRSLGGAMAPPTPSTRSSPRFRYGLGGEGVSPSPRSSPLSTRQGQTARPR
eukprot:525639-Prorocentrum_minimum.AAC.1